MSKKSRPGRFRFLVTARAIAIADQMVLNQMVQLRYSLAGTSDDMEQTSAIL